MGSQSLYVNSIGSPDDWTSSSNIIGSADGSCGTTSTDNGQVNLVFVGFTGIPDNATIDGFEVDVWWAISDDNDSVTVTLDTGYGTAPTVKTLSSGGINTNCTGVVQETEGSSTDMWGYTGGTITGDHVNDASDVKVTLEHWDVAKGGTSYVDAVQVTIHYTESVTEYIYASAGIGINAEIAKDIHKEVDAGIGINAEIAKDIHKEVDAGIGVNAISDTSKTVNILASAGVGINVGETKSITKAVDSGIGINADVAKDIHKEISAGIGINADVDTTINAPEWTDWHYVNHYTPFGDWTSFDNFAHDEDGSCTSTTTQGNKLYGLISPFFDMPAGCHIGGVELAVKWASSSTSANEGFSIKYEISGNLDGTFTTNNVNGASTAIGCSNCEWATFGSSTEDLYSGTDLESIHLWRYDMAQMVVGPGDLNHGIKILIEKTIGSTYTYYIDAVKMRVYYINSENYVNTNCYGTNSSSATWTNASNADGAPDDTCAYYSGTSNGTLSIENPILSIIGVADIINGLVVEIDAAASSTPMNMYVTLSSYYQTSPSRLVEVTSGTTCGDCTTYTLGGYNDLWTDWSDNTGTRTMGSDYNSAGDTVIDITCNPGGNTIYIDAIRITYYYSEVESYANYPVKSGGASSGTWSNPSNAEGTHDNLCASSSSNGDILTCYPNQFSTFPSTAVIIGLEIEVACAQSLSGGELNVTPFLDSGSSMGEPYGLVPPNVTDCTGAIGKNFGWFYSVWWLNSAITEPPVGADYDGTDFGFEIEHVTSGSETAYVDYVRISFWYVDAYEMGPEFPSGATYYSFPTAGIGINALIAKEIDKVLTAGVGINADITKDITKPLDAGVGISASATALKMLYLYLDAGVGISVAAVKSITKALAAAVGVSATEAKSISKKVAAGVGVSATVAKNIAKALAAGVGINASTIKNIGKKISASIGINAAKVKNITKAIAAGIGINSVAQALRIIYMQVSADIGISATKVKSLTKALAADIGVSVQKVKNITKVLAAGVGINALADATVGIFLYLNAGIGISATKVKSITKVLAASIGISATATALKTAYLYLSAGIGIGATKTKSIIKALSAGVGISATKVKNITKALSVGVGINAAAIATIVGVIITYLYVNAGIGISALKKKNITKVLSAGIGISATATALKVLYLYLNAGIGIAATKTKSITKALAAGIGISAAKVKNIGKKVAAGLGISGSESKSVGKKLSAGIGISATKVKSITKSLAIGIGISVTKIKNIIKRLAAGIGILTIGWRPIHGRLYGVLSVDMIHGGLSADVISGTMTADMWSANLSYEVPGTYGTADVITDALSYSGGDFDGSWAGEYSSTVSLDAGEAQVGSYAIKVTGDPATGLQVRYTFDSPVDISAYTHMDIRIRPTDELWWVYMPFFYIGVTETTDNWGDPDSMYILGSRMDNNDTWQTLSLPLSYPDFSYTDADLTKIKSIYIEAYSEDNPTAYMWIDGIQFKDYTPSYAQADLTTGVPLSDHADKITESLITNDGEYYDGWWRDDYYWGPGYGQEITLEGADKTTGDYSINIYLPVTPERTLAKQPACQWAYIFEKVFDLTKFERMSFDLKMAVQDYDSIEIEFYDWDWWVISYEPTLTDDGNWHNYDIDLGVRTGYYDDPEFMWDKVVWMNIVLRNNSYTTEHDHYMDNFRFVTNPWSVDLRADLTTDDIYATMTTEVIQ